MNVGTIKEFSKMKNINFSTPLRTNDITSTIAEFFLQVEMRFKVKIRNLYLALPPRFDLVTTAFENMENETARRRDKATWS